MNDEHEQTTLEMALVSAVHGWEDYDGSAELLKDVQQELHAAGYAIVPLNELARLRAREAKLIEALANIVKRVDDAPHQGLVLRPNRAPIVAARDALNEVKVP